MHGHLSWQQARYHNYVNQAIHRSLYNTSLAGSYVIMMDDACIRVWACTSWKLAGMHHFLQTQWLCGAPPIPLLLYSGSLISHTSIHHHSWLLDNFEMDKAPYMETLGGGNGTVEVAHHIRRKTIWHAIIYTCKLQRQSS